MYKELFGVIAIILTFIAFFPYIRSIFQKKTKPHVFSWIIWGSTTFIVFLAQFADKGGAGAWVTGVSGIITLYIAILAYIKRSDISITRIDWLFFMLAMISLPFWYLTSNPLWAVVILTIVDILGFGPTIRKAHAQPFEENLIFYILFVPRNIIAIAALEHYSLTTVLFPIVTAVACLLLVLMVVYRKRMLAL